jgi:hypothetical protein
MSKSTPVLFRSGINLRTITANKYRTTGNASLQRFLLDGFRSYFTILSDCFSIFRHRTCSLSVSGRYFNQVLDGVYHPLQAVIPDSPTRRRRSEKCPRARYRLHTGLSPSGVCLFRQLLPALRDWTRTLHSSHNSMPPLPGHRLTGWTLSSSLAVTKEIAVAFFSSAY